MHKQHYSYEDCKTVKLSSKVETEILLNFSISPSGKVCINIEKLRTYE